MTREPTSSIAKLAWATARRERNQAVNACINENKARTHGKATHGRRCYRCHKAWNKTK